VIHDDAFRFVVFAISLRRLGWSVISEDLGRDSTDGYSNGMGTVFGP
jgi:hypothetical protein